MIGPDNQARILDFGIGSLLVENKGESLVDTMSTANTLTSGLDWSSPEIVHGADEPHAGRRPVQPRLRALLLFDRRVPFPEDTVSAKLVAIQFQDPEPVRDIRKEIPQELADIVERLMQKKPDNRYGNMQEVVDALEMVAEQPGDDLVAAVAEEEAKPDFVLMRASKQESSSSIQVPMRESLNIRRKMKEGDHGGAELEKTVPGLVDAGPTQPWLLYAGAALVAAVIGGLAFWYLQRGASSRSADAPGIS